MAGTPSLAAFDVLHASGGGDAPYDLTLTDGRVLARPGSLFGVTESALGGTWPAFAAAQVLQAAIAGRVTHAAALLNIDLNP